MTAIRPATRPQAAGDRRTLDAFDGLTAALGRATRPPAAEGAEPAGLPETEPLPSAIIGSELCSSVILLTAVLGVPLLLLLFLFG